MPSALGSVFLIYCFVLVVMGVSGIFRQPTLERRLGSLVRLGWLLLPGLVAVVIDVFVQTSGMPSAPTEVAREGTASTQWYEAMQAAARLHTALLCGLLLLLLVVLAVPVLAVLRDLRSFVMTHNQDLVGRDQAALAAAQRRPAPDHG